MRYKKIAISYLVLILCLCFGFCYNSMAAGGRKKSVTSGSSKINGGKTGSPAKCHTGNCMAVRTIGGMIIRFKATSDNMKNSGLFNYTAPEFHSPSSFTGCKKRGGYVYAYVGFMASDSKRKKWNGKTTNVLAKNYITSRADMNYDYAGQTVKLGNGMKATILSKAEETEAIRRAKSLLREDDKKVPKNLNGDKNSDVKYFCADAGDPPECQKVGNKWYGKKGEETDEATYKKECTKKCQKVDGVWYDINGKKTNEKGYKKSCGCQKRNGKWYDANAKETDGAGYKKSCEKTTTTTTTTTTINIRCGNGGFNTTVITEEKADTKSRLAVENMSLEGHTPYMREWTINNGVRTGIHNDSRWTAESDNDIYNIAKPGDSVRFVHQICMGVRYGLQTRTQDEWVGSQSHDRKYTREALPNSRMKIGGIPNDLYAFGDGIADINSQAAAVDWQASRPGQKGQFNDTAATYVDTSRYQISTLSPSEGKTNWKCSGIFDFEDDETPDPYKRGGFQIPGFDTRSCEAGDLVGNNNLVGIGNVFGQYHEFNALKMWEVYNHTYGGSCGCGVNDAWFGGNHNANSFESAWQGNGLGHRQNYQCRPKEGENNCEWHCTAGYTDEYGVYHCTDGYYAKYNYPYVTDEGRHSFKFMYHSTHRDYGTKTKTAKVYVPYNFETTVGSSIDTGEYIPQGGAIQSTFNWSINPRENEITSNFDYATVTPPGTKVQFIEFIYDPNTNDFAGDDRSQSDPCAFYASKGGLRCDQMETINGNQNPDGFYGGESFDKSFNRTIPDDEEYIGFKYCVAMGIYPAESHNYEGNTIQNNSHNGIGMVGGTLWNISGASCRTISKKPNYQVWNGSIYTQGDVTSEITDKTLNAPFHTNYNGSSNQVFGSWVDYAIIANGTVEGTSSGAGLGFDNNSYTLGLPGGNSSAAYDDYSTDKQTLSNNDDTLGHSNINASASINTNLQRLFSRYKDKAASLATSMNTTANNSQIITSDTGFQFVYAPGKTLNTSNISKEVSKSSENPNYNTVTANGDIYKSLSQGAGAKADNTLVIVADTVNINGDICTGAPCGSDSTRQYDYAHRNTNAAATIPQILIFANNINISENVTRVDAWLVADNGTVNTCSGQDLEAGDSGGVNPGYRNVRSYNAGTCAKTLMVNGPVYARDLKLNRTAGAHHGSGSLSSNDVLQRSVGDNGGADDKKKGSIAPAEIFNLRADVYLWAYNQAERSSEAVVTYVRELAPRY